MAINRSNIGQQIMKAPLKKKKVVEKLKKKKVVEKADGGLLSYLSPAYALSKGSKNYFSHFTPIGILDKLMNKEKKKDRADTDPEFNTSDDGTRGLSVRSIKKGGKVGPKGCGVAQRGYGKAMKKGK